MSEIQNDENFLNEFENYLKEKEPIKTNVNFLDNIIEKGIPIGKINMLVGESKIGYVMQDFITKKVLENNGEKNGNKTDKGNTEII